jgi:hypothetical protein
MISGIYLSLFQLRAQIIHISITTAVDCHTFLGARKVTKEHALDKIIAEI